MLYANITFLNIAEGPKLLKSYIDNIVIEIQLFL